MLKPIDWPKAQKAIDKCKASPRLLKLGNFDINEFRAIAESASEDAYMELMKQLEGQKELQDLLFAISHLTFVSNRFEDLAMSDIEHAKKIIGKLWPRLASS